MEIIYASEPNLAATAFRDVLIASGLRRPVDDIDRLEAMLRHANIIITARHGERLVGVARALSDFAYCCYLSDLAVDVAYQRQGIGQRLIAETKDRVGDRATLILVAAPAAETYYPRIGLQHMPSCWVIPRTH